MGSSSETQEPNMMVVDEVGWSPGIEDIYAEDSQQILAGIRWLRNRIIGSDRQKNLVVYETGTLPRLLSLLEEAESPLELRREVAVVLSSLAKGSRQQVAFLVSAGTVAHVLTNLLHPDLRFVEAGLRCLRSVFSTDMAPVALIYQDQNAIPLLLSVMNRSPVCQECVSFIFSRCCLTETHQAVLSHAGLIEGLATALFSEVTSTQTAALNCLALLCASNPETSNCVLTASFDGCPLMEKLSVLMRRDQPLAIQLGAAKCVASLLGAGAIQARLPIVTNKAMPTAVRLCRKDELLCSWALRAEACKVLSTLVEADGDLQKLAAANNQCLHALTQCLCIERERDREPSRAEREEGEDLEEKSLTAAACLALNDEDIRRRMTLEHQQLVDSAVRNLSDRRRHPKLLLASARLLHALSRSVEQLRTTFQDSNIWKPFFEFVHTGSEELVTISSAVLCNFSLEFSPFRDTLIEAGMLDVFSALARREELNLRLNGIWGLMNLSYRADDELKMRMMESLGGETILKLLTETPADSPVVIRLLGLARNLVSQTRESRSSYHHVDEMTRLSGTHIIQAVVFVLEDEYSIEAKQLALCILSNIAAGDSSKDLIMANEDVLRKIVNFMMASNPSLQAIAISCVTNLSWKTDSGAEDRHIRLRELGVQKALQQLHNTSDAALVDKVKAAIQQFS